MTEVNHHIPILGIKISEIQMFLAIDKHSRCSTLVRHHIGGYQVPKSCFNDNMQVYEIKWFRHLVIENCGIMFYRFSYNIFMQKRASAFGRFRKSFETASIFEMLNYSILPEGLNESIVRKKVTHVATTPIIKSLHNRGFRTTAKGDLLFSKV
ncbi:UNVERIFIED_CONTAM: hypothetical protein NCL1_14848 [Trichonephila clavipes]